MAQIEVFEYLKGQREKGLEDYYSVLDIYKAISNSEEFDTVCKPRIYSAVMQLEAYDYLEVVKKGKISNFSRCFRIKDKYVSKLDG